ncbi:MAG: hypothetical protein ACRD0W_13950 [Acidimicrobiales bacterium]
MIVIRNPRGPESPRAPTRPDGGLYRFEMIFGGWGHRAYADTEAELCGALIPGYGELLDDTARMKARIIHAVTEQVQLQASINVASDPEASTEADREVLLGPRHVQPPVARWDCDVPLVLVDIYYEPLGRLPRPPASRGGTGRPRPT